MNTVMATALAQADHLSPVQRSVRDHFQTGGSLIAAGMMVLIIALLVASAYAVARLTERSTARMPTNDPPALFRSLLKRLGVDQEQRKWLERVAREQSLANPSVLLLSPTAFEAGFQKWRMGRDHSPNAEVERTAAAMITATRDTLFPSESVPAQFDAGPAPQSKTADPTV